MCVFPSFFQPSTLCAYILACSSVSYSCIFKSFYILGFQPPPIDIFACFNCSLFCPLPASTTLKALCWFPFLLNKLWNCTSSTSVICIWVQIPCVHQRWTVRELYVFTNVRSKIVIFSIYCSDYWSVPSFLCSCFVCKCENISNVYIEICLWEKWIMRL